ncbi:MAG: DUF1802 family protein [Candidatus Obscuribacterales bacterium]|nr:DUF1802 family protein [Candidatus Obscuribacterales bacterium]
MEIDFGYKEWAGVIDAMNSGSQTVMVRSYKPRQNFLLYPTFSYKGAGGRQFQSKYQSLAHDSATRIAKLSREQGLVEVFNYASVDTVCEVSKDQWAELQPFFIWSKEHIESYIQGRQHSTVLLWLIRVYRFDTPIIFQTGGAVATFRPPEPMQITIPQSVLSDEQFQSIKTQILRVLK